MTTERLTLRTGSWVEIRPTQEILATLDERGELARMPFMPEMLRFSGQRFQVAAIAHKTCDTVGRTGGRKVADAVHLADLRCDGSAHGGCQAACLLFWKTAWLKPVPGPHATTASGEAGSGPADMPETLTRACASKLDDGATVYRCQATTLPRWTEPLRWWDIRQYWLDVHSGNVTLRHALSILALAGLYKLRHLPVAFRINRYIYRKAHQWLRGFPDPHLDPRIPRKGRTPTVELALRPGELVEIRSLAEINTTINATQRNRGMFISEDETRHCGRQARVARRVTQIIDERTGQMIHFGNSCIVLEGVDCLGEYADKRLLCPRRINCYWREAWLKRVDAAPGSGQD